MTISTLPVAPSRADDPTNFSSKADALVASLDTFVAETNADISIVNANAAIAAAGANTATTKAAEAAASATSAAGAAGAAKWLAATAYTQGQTAWSPINYQTYRRTVAGTTATDPSADSANWALISAGAINHFVLQANGIL